jgi:PKD repeat protein
MDWKTKIENFSDPTVCFTPSDSYIQAGDSVLFENCSKIYNQLHWDFGDGTSSESARPYHVFKSKGIFNVTLTVTHRKIKRQVTQKIYCGMQASAQVTYNFSDWDIPSNYLNTGYTIVIDCSIYSFRAGANNQVAVSNQQYFHFNSSDSFNIAFPLRDEHANYQVKTVLRGIYPNPSNPADAYISEDLGTFYTDSIKIFGSPLITGSKKTKFANLNYSASIQIN